MIRRSCFTKLHKGDTEDHKYLDYNFSVVLRAFSVSLCVITQKIKIQ